MRIAKSRKIILMLISVLFVLTACLFVNSAKTVHAEDLSTAFVCNTNTTVEGKDNNVVFSVKNDSRFTIKNRLSIDEILFECSVSSGVKEISVITTYDSYFANGINKQGTEELDKEIQSQFKITANGTNFDLDLNGKQDSIAKNLDFSVGFTVENYVLSAYLNNGTISKTITNDKDYYKVAGKDKSIAKIEFVFSVEDGAENQTFSIKSVDQKALSDTTGAYKQTFEENYQLAKPVVSINDSQLKDNLDSSTIKTLTGDKLTLSFTPYALFDGITASDLYFAKGSVGTDNITLPTGSNPGFARFYKLDSVASCTSSFKVVSSETGSLTKIEYEEYAVEIVDDTEVCPVYEINADKTPKDLSAYNAYKLAVIKATKTTQVINGVEKEYDIIGEDFTVPSLENFVTDDLTSYANLTHTLYYFTPSASNTTSGWKIPVSEQGRYYFYVTFSDNSKVVSSIDSEKFILDNDDENVIVYGDYQAFVFSFDIVDNAPFSVKPAEETEKGEGYLNQKYTVKPFEINAYKYTATYTLYYNGNKDATEDDEGWVKVVQGADFSANEVSKIGFDGNRTFTPTKAGAYKIECNIVSTNEVRSATASKVVVIEKEATLVHPDTHWFENNMPSVIFLSIGTVLLVVLLIIIFKKPKDAVHEKKKTNE